MLAKFKVSNFKSFQDDFQWDLTSREDRYDFNENCIKNHLVRSAIVYGKNGVGKSNLGFAIFDIVEHLTDKRKSELDYNHYMNAYSKENYVAFYYEFVIDDIKIVYKYRKKDYKTIIYEELLMDNVCLAYIDRQKSNKALVKFKGAETLNTDLADNY